jgi:hypothetical protein
MDGWMDGWMDECKIGFKELLSTVQKGIDIVVISTRHLLDILVGVDIL